MELLVASLAACTVQTLKVYCDHKKLKVDAVTVDIASQDKDGVLTLRRSLKINAPALSAAEKQRMVEIAAKCPVGKAISHEKLRIVDVLE